MDTKLALSLDPFTSAYLFALMWANISDDEGTPLDEYGTDDLDSGTVTVAEAECKRFQKENAEFLEIAYSENDEYDESQAGHDFALTRNCHGTGFWDRGLGDTGEKLTKAALSYKALNGFFQDGKVYFE